MGQRQGSDSGQRQRTDTSQLQKRDTGQRQAADTGRRRGEEAREPLIAESRRTAILGMLRASGSVSVAELQSKLGVSSMTARRDLAELARRGLAQRTHGGAVVPSVSAHEDSFAQRLDAATDAKTALARAAAQRLRPRDTAFIDSSTTGFFVAREILELGIELTLVTNSLPVMQLVAGQAPPNVDLVAVGGTLRPLTQSFVGPHAVRTVEGHFADHAFISVKALTRTAVLADADPLEAEVKQAMVHQASDAVLLVDRSKLAARGLNAIVAADELALVIVYDVDADDLRPLREAGVPLQRLGPGAPPAEAPSKRDLISRRPR